VADDERMRQVLAKQLGMNQKTWEALQGRGVTEDSQLRLDFLYQASGESQARALAAFVGKPTTRYTLSPVVAAS
jgi:hypothetical protein